MNEWLIMFLFFDVSKIIWMKNEWCIMYTASCLVQERARTEDMDAFPGLLLFLCKTPNQVRLCYIEMKK
jgi:hypothetical protein